MSDNSKRKYSSSASELDTSKNTSVSTPTEVKPKKKKKGKAKKQKMADETKEELKLLTKSIDEINKKLNNILTKDNKAIIREIITETLDQMKDKLVGSIIKRLDNMEGEMHERALENATLMKKIETMSSREETLTKERNKLKAELSQEVSLREKQTNELEQYGRRNNVRITGIDDSVAETAEMTTTKVVNLMNDKLSMSVSEHDVDISHRMGKFDQNKKRPIIVKFTRRHVQHDVMKNAKMLRGTGIYINEDLTKLNAKVLTAVRVKDKDNVARAWSFQGKLFLKYVTDQIEEVKYKDFAYWLNKDWPKDTEPVVTEVVVDMDV